MAGEVKNRLRSTRDYGLLLLAGVLLAASLISQIPSNVGIIRALDMIHEPAIYLCLLLTLVAAFSDGRFKRLSAGGFLLAAAVNVATLWPFLPIAPTQVNLADSDGGECFTALSLNVLMSNRDYGRTAQLIDERDPDVLLLLETDTKWEAALSEQLARYPERVSRPLDNTYGLLFATRLAVDQSSISNEAGELTPTLYASLRGPRDTPFDFVGLHPRPPKPGQDTKARDRAIFRMDEKTNTIAKDVVVMGDFNDVPWSHTMTNLRERGEFRDPRVGRGTMPTFPAALPWLGWPLDHILVRNGVGIRSFETLDSVGADHLPLFAELCLGEEGDR